MASEAVVSEIWRYPVKSMRGERLPSARIGLSGILGDRGWAVRDEEAGEIRGAKKLPHLLRCEARYLEEPSVDRIPPAEILFPDGSTLRSDDPKAAARLSELLGRRVSLSAVRPKEDVAYYERGKLEGDLETELRAVFGLEPGDPLPDPSEFGEEFLRFAAPPGTHFDASSLHIVSTASLRAMAEREPDGNWDVRRFRPNLLVASDEADSVELSWCGRRVGVGGAVVEVEEPTLRCVMTTLAQDDLPGDPGIMRSLVKHSKQCLGVYAGVETAGIVKVDDKISVF
jgi:uncharacterized protein YcbX